MKIYSHESSEVFYQNCLTIVNPNKNLVVMATNDKILKTLISVCFLGAIDLSQLFTLSLPLPLSLSISLCLCVCVCVCVCVCGSLPDG